jgi:hypothetical protein
VRLLLLIGCKCQMAFWCMYKQLIIQVVVLFEDQGQGLKAHTLCHDYCCHQSEFCQIGERKYEKKGPITFVSNGNHIRLKSFYRVETGIKRTYYYKHSSSVNFATYWGILCKNIISSCIEHILLKKVCLHFQSWYRATFTNSFHN